MKATFPILFLLYTATTLGQLKEPTEAKKFADMITAKGLSSSLHLIASDYYKGRGSGTEDEKAVASYLAGCYMMMDIPPLTDDYFQKFDYSSAGQTKKSQNVIGFLEGSDPILKKEAVIIVAHYDHLGKNSTLTGDQIFNGAADDGSGTAALLHIAKSFAAARSNGYRPKRSIIFFHSGAEEDGTKGSTYYVNKAPLWPLEKTAAVINMDGVGGSDTAVKKDGQNYVYVLHADSTSGHLYQKTKELNSSAGLDLALLYPPNPDRFRSDHSPYSYELVPYIYFSTGLTENYHKVSDRPETINYDHMAKIAKLVFAISWEASMTASFHSTFDRSQYVKKGFICPPCGCARDKTFFNNPGICDACSMDLVPAPWEKKKK